MQQPATGGGILDWFGNTIRKVGDAAADQYVRANFPEKITDGVNDQPVDATARSQDEQMLAQRRNRDLMVMGGAALAVGILVATWIAK